MTSPQNLVKNVICPDALLGRKALVGGASKGLGQAIAQALASAGAVVHGLSRDEVTLSAAIQDLPGSGHRATAVDFDHSEELGNVVGDECYDLSLIHI